MSSEPVKVRLTATIANEYMTRDVFPDAWDVGMVTISRDVAAQMLADCEFYCDPYGPDVPATLRKAYKAHDSKLREALRATA